MVNRDLLAAKLAELHDRVERVKARTPQSAQQLASDRDALDIVSFNLMLAVQTCADIASHLIADETWPSARSLAESFTRMSEHGVIDPRIAEALKRAVGLRNVVAHGYSGIDIESCFKAATLGLADLQDFALQVSDWANAPGA